MKTLIFFGFMMAMGLQTLAQTPSFLFSLKATNALGHKDSVLIGTHADNNNGFEIISGIDGEQLIDIPADSNMDMRVSAINRLYRTDKRITLSLCHLPMTSPMDHLNQVVIYIYAKKWPVRLSWDSTLFAQTYCVNKSFFSVTRYSTVPGPDSINPESFYAPIRMAALHGSLNLDSILYSWMSSNWLWPENNITLNNGKQGKYFSVALFLNKKLGRGTGLINAKKPLILSLYPNPVTDELVIEQGVLQGQSATVQIWTMQGQLVQSQKIEKNTNGTQKIITSGLRAGLYMVELRAKDGSIARGKFVKR